MEEFQSLNYKFMDVKSCSLREEEDENYVYCYIRYSISLVFHWWEIQVDVPASLSLYTSSGCTAIYTHIYTHGTLQSIRNEFINRLVVRVVVGFKVYKNIEKRYLWNSLWITIVLHMVSTPMYIIHRVTPVWKFIRNSMDCTYTFLSISSNSRF